MIQLKLILFGITVVGAIALAVYNHYNTEETQQHQQYGENPHQKRRRRSPSPIQRWSQNDSSSGPKSLPQCSICYCIVSDDIYGRKLSCGHSFHKACIQPWLSLQKTCPNCRSAVM